MPDASLPILFLGILTGVAALVLKGTKHLRGGDENAVDSLASWPGISVIVPVTGSDPRMVEHLESLLLQHYPSSYEVVFATRDTADPATAIVRRLVDRYPLARQVLAGEAHGCGQKNRNLLAGVMEVSPASEVLVFCDGTRLAPQQWLKELVRPIALGQAVVATGLHYGIVDDMKAAGLGQAITILLITLLRCFKGFNQPWGGSTAILRQVFEELQVARTWASNVVDDVSLAFLLRQAGIPAVLATQSYLYTPISAQTWSGWRDWLTRQWLYLKFIFPWSWLAGGICCHAAAGLLLIAVIQCVISLLPGATPQDGILSALFLVLLEVLGTRMRRLHPRPGPLSRWLMMFPAALLMCSWCHLRGTFTRTIHWRGIRYPVARGGKVVANRVRFH